MKKIIKTTSKILLVVSSSLFVFFSAGDKIALENKEVINQFLNEKTFEFIKTGESGDSEYFKSDFSSIKDLTAVTQKKASEVEEGGAVLLKNDNDALPIDSTSKVTLFGYGSYSPAYGGSGSAQSDNPFPEVDLKSALEEKGISVNPDVYSIYNVNSKKYQDTKYKINDAPFSDFKSVQESYKDYSDAAIVVIKRSRGENNDPPVKDTQSDGKNGDYLNLNDNERSLIRGVCDLKGTTFKRVVVLLNSANSLDMEFVKEFPAIDSVLWIGTVGQTGLRGVANVLSGEINPSGRLSDTYYYSNLDNPSVANFGDHTYKNSDIYKDRLPKQGNSSYTSMSYNKYVVYREGIYTGYRYPETRYEDYIIERENAGEFNYDETICYPFGYGLSYTEFEHSEFSVKYDEKKDTYTASVKVKNTGKRDGRDVVQLYLQKPYTDYDIENQIEKSSVELVGFKKTKLLAPNEEETISVEVKRSDFTTFDDEVLNSYILESGEYYLTVGTDAHNAINNILSKKDAFSKKTFKYGNSNLSAKLDIDEDKTTYTKTDNEVEIHSSFSEADMNKASYRGDNSIDYTTRNSWLTTLPANEDDYVELNLNDAMVEKLVEQTNSDDIKRDDTPYPTYSADNGLSLIDMLEDEDHNKISYDDKAWDMLLDQLSYDETCDLVTTGMRKTGACLSVSKPQTVEHNGPNGVTEKYSYGATGLATLTDDPDKDYSPTYYPCLGILASSFDTELAYEVGKLYGEDALWAGYQGLYGIGVNLHRTPYDGRAFEYYSEDPLLTGAMASMLTHGLQEKGCNAYVKHLAVYEQQANRVGLSVYCDEQTLREIYLKPFEMVIRDGGAKNVMASYTRMGLTYCAGNKNLLVDFIRDECSLTGLIVSDMWANRYLDDQLAHFISSGLTLVDGDIADKKPLEKYREGYGSFANDLREAAHRILYSTLQTNAMNGIEKGMVMRLLTPKWQKTLNIVNISLLVFLILSCVYFATYVTIEILDNFSQKKPQGGSNNEKEKI